MYKKLHIATQLGTTIVSESDQFSSKGLATTSDNDVINFAKLLIAKGANLNSKDKDGETPFQWAMRNNRTDFIEFFNDTSSKS